MIHGGARESNPGLLRVNHIRYATMPRPCDAIECGYVVISTNDC